VPIFGVPCFYPHIAPKGANGTPAGRDVGRKRNLKPVFSV